MDIKAALSEVQTIFCTDDSLIALSYLSKVPTRSILLDRKKSEEILITNQQIVLMKLHTVITKQQKQADTRTRRVSTNITDCMFIKLILVIMIVIKEQNKSNHNGYIYKPLKDIC